MTIDEKVPQTSPRGTERMRRRADQALHKAQADAEAATLRSPTTPDKLKQIELKRKGEIARFGPTKKTRRETLQREHRDASDREARVLGERGAAQIKVELPPAGQQVDLVTARRVAKQTDRAESHANRDAARAAGRAVLETLQGRPPLPGINQRFRRVARHNARQDTLSEKT